MTLQQMLSSGGLLARKGTAAPLGLRRPQPSSEDELESRDGAAEGGADSPEAEARAPEDTAPVQLDLVPDISGKTPETEAEDPPPPASLLPFSLRREHPDSGETWELVSSEIFERMAGLRKDAPAAEPAPAATDDVAEAKAPDAETKEEPAEESTAKTAPETPPEAASESEVPESETTESETTGPAAALDGDAKPEESAPAPAETAPTEPAATAPEDSETTAKAKHEPVEDKSPTLSSEPESEPAPAAADAMAKPAVPAPVPSQAASAPVADPTWRIGEGPVSSTSSAATGRWVLFGAAACVLIAGIAWWSYSSQPSGPEAPAASPTASPRASQDTQSAAVPSEAPADQAAPSLAPQASAPASTPASGIEQDAAVASESPAEPAPQSAPAASVAPGPAELAPSVDLVRIEPDGDAVIAGRAAPNSELIVLDNGMPIGTVTADAFGEWVFVPDEPLSEGPHEFGLVLKSVQGTVAVPAGKGAGGEATQGDAPVGDAPGAGDSPEQAAPKPEEGAALQIEGGGEATPLPSRKPQDASDAPDATGASELRVPIPLRKPGTEPNRTGARQTGEGEAPEAATETSGDLGFQAPNSDFVVQLASVKTRDGARQEWAKLQSRFPEVLNGMSLNLDEAKLSQKGTVVRVRTGPFPDLNEAVNFCQRLRAGRQDCLVVRTNVRNLSMVEAGRP